MARKTQTSKNFSASESMDKLVASLSVIQRTVSENGLSQALVLSLADDIEVVKNHFPISDIAAILLAGIIECGGEDGANKKSLAGYLGCSNIQFMGFSRYLNELVDAGIIFARRSMHTTYCVSPEAMRSISENRRYVPIKNSGLTADELFSRFRKLFSKFRTDDINSDELIEDLDEIIDNNRHLEFCQKVKEAFTSHEYSDTERRIFLYLCHRFVTHGDKAMTIDVLMNFIDYFEDDMYLRRRLALEESPLQVNGLVSFSMDNGFVDKDMLSLSDMVRNTFLNEIELTPEAAATHKDLVKCGDITAKELFYNKDEAGQIGRLYELLKEDNFKDVQRRLEEKGMRKGFNVILYGGPGTGKTACVYEIARKTGRDVFCVNMSELKSKWVGDSEKNVKGIFDTYRAMVRTHGKTPILFFNEADAIFSKRLTNVTESVDMMNNAIQNIILNEMENIDGILFATTNLVGNLDTAFERRFIFKVELRTPDEGCRSKIWKSMISDLSDNDASELAHRYTFAGGNIENIARKSTIEYVLSGMRPSVESLSKLCDEESLQRRKQIGYQ